MRVPLSAPVMSFSRTVEPIQAMDSLQRVAQLFESQGVAVLPVVEGERFLGVLPQSSVLDWLDDPALWTGAVRDHALTGVPTVTPLDSGSAALRLISDHGLQGIAIIGRDDRWVSMVYPATFLAVQEAGVRSRPPPVGGMATPFGVYLTDGAHTGGVHPAALIATGATLASFLVLASVLTYPIVVYTQHWPAEYSSAVISFATTVLFLTLMRVFPIAGIHAAEHMTVHAIERGEALTPDVVKRMPRVHPRCGTNLAAGFGIAMAVKGIVGSDEGFFLGAIIALFMWRQLGSFLQYWFTTRPPSEKHIRMGIKAGEDILRKNIEQPDVPNSPWRRLVLSGIPLVILGSSLFGFFFYLLSLLFPVLDKFVPIS